MKCATSLFFCGTVIELGISCALRVIGEYEHLQIQGTIDADAAVELRDLLIETIEQCAHHILVDVTGVVFLDASGIGVLVGALKHARTKNRDIDLVCDDPRLLKIFRVTSLDRLFGIHESTIVAMRSGESSTVMTTSSDSVGAAS